MSAQFLHLGKHIVNVDQIVSAKRLEAEPAREQFDPYSKSMMQIKALPVRVKITLTSIEKDCYEIGESGIAAASASQTVTVSGELAERVWTWFENRADIANLETVAE